MKNKHLNRIVDQAGKLIINTAERVQPVVIHGELPKGSTAELGERLKRCNLREIQKKLGNQAVSFGHVRIIQPGEQGYEPSFEQQLDRVLGPTSDIKIRVQADIDDIDATSVKPSRVFDFEQHTDSNEYVTAQKPLSTAAFMAKLTAEREAKLRAAHDNAVADGSVVEIASRRNVAPDSGEFTANDSI